MKKIMWGVFLPFVLLACATVQPISTKSGMPEVTICKLDKTEIMEKFAAALSMDGWNIRSANNYQIVAGKPASNLLISALFGSRYDSTPESRMIFTFADVSGNCTYIGARLQIVTNPGSGFERITDYSRGKDAHELQQQLENLKSLVEESRTGKAAITEPRLSPPQPQPQTPPQVTDTPRKLVSASEYNKRGFEYYKNAQYNKAIEDFTTALAMEGNPSSSIYINRGASFYELKQYDKALADFKQAITVASDNARGYLWCGNVYYASRSYREALEYFSKAIAIDPNNAVYHLNRGYANSKIGNRLMALSDFKKACELGNRDGCNQVEREQKK